MLIERFHGGRVPGRAIDFSTPINPLGPPKPVVEALNEALRRARSYPDYGYEKLRNAIAEFYGVDPRSVMPLNGAAESLTLALLAFKPRVLVTFEPTFGDHKATLSPLGVGWVSIQLKEAWSRFEFDWSYACSLPRRLVRGSLVLVSNPNNPTGALAGRRVVERVASCLEDAILLVDEAFMDLSPGGESLLGSAPSNVIVVRSLTKTLALPGLRIGFLYSDNLRMLARLEAARQPWNVNSIAEHAVTEAFVEAPEEVAEHLEASRRLVREALELLSRRLSKLGFRVYDSRAPFILVRHHPYKHPALNHRLLKLGFYVRDASTFHGLTPYHSRISARPLGECKALLEALEMVVNSEPGML